MINNHDDHEPVTNASPLVARTEATRALLVDMERVAATTATVLIRGESGVGKELVARAIHHASPRRGLPFVKVNCAALPADLLESELFGHERGAFTGAYRRKPGKFELASGGTIFLDEIAELPPALQAKLLHVLQDREFARVGGSEVLRASARVIAATNCELEAAIGARRFRSDLYYRLNVVTLRVPPLRERREEIPLLARLFLARFNAEYKRRVELAPATMALLEAYSWPGNVRELENMMRRVVVLQNEAVLVEELRALIGSAASPPRATLAADRTDGKADAAEASRPTAGTNGQPAAPGHGPEPTGEPPSLPRWAMLRDLARRAAIDAEREALVDVLQRVQWNRAEAARVLGLSYKGLLYKLDRCGLGRKRPPTVRSKGASSGVE
jgi:two-component system, NtrC family, response regulator AtoC